VRATLNGSVSISQLFGIRFQVNIIAGLAEISRKRHK
jgi:hypothetical protein